MEDHTVAVKMVIDALLDSNHGVVSSAKEINAVGHRVVHGGFSVNKIYFLLAFISESKQYF